MERDNPRRGKPEVGRYFCEECERYFDTEGEYDEHFRKHHKKEMEKTGRPSSR